MPALFSNLGGFQTFVEGSGTPFVIDSDATLVDPNIPAGTSFNGTHLSLDDFGAGGVFGTTGSLSFTGSGSGNVLLGATQVGTYSAFNDTLQISFNTNAFAADVNGVLDQLTYVFPGSAPPVSTAITFNYDDGVA